MKTSFGCLLNCMYILRLVGHFSYEFPLISKIVISILTCYLTSGIRCNCFATSCLVFLDGFKIIQRGNKNLYAFGTNALTAYFVAGILVSFNNAEINLFHLIV